MMHFEYPMMRVLLVQLWVVFMFRNHAHPRIIGYWVVVGRSSLANITWTMIQFMMVLTFPNIHKELTCEWLAIQTIKSIYFFGLGNARRMRRCANNMLMPKPPSTITLFSVMLLMVIVLKPHDGQFWSCSIAWCIAGECKVVIMDINVWLVSKVFVLGCRASCEVVGNFEFVLWVSRWEGKLPSAIRVG